MHLNDHKPSSWKETNDSEEFDSALRPYAQTALPTMSITCPGCQSVVNPKRFFRDNLRFCFHTGQWYCKGCHLGNTAHLPSQILTNWNFKRFPVCETSFAELNATQNEPTLDLAALCPRFYNRLPEFALLRKYRERLISIAEILFPCDARESLIDSKPDARVRMHFFGSGDFVSLVDLLDLKNGRLIPELDNMIRRYKVHIVSCESCLSRGNLCGLCNSPEILFPFETETTVRCKTCGHVYHSSCVDMLNATGNVKCPNCEKNK